MRKFFYCLVAILALSTYDASAQQKGDKYMSYLEESGKVIGELNYETGGRPCMRYKA